MLIADRNGMAVGGWVNPYVTDGLIAMWDGIWNVAGGKHDNGSEAWKDLSGNGNDAVIVKGSGYSRSSPFDENSCTMDGTFSWAFTASTSVVDAVKGDCTLEVVRKLGTPSLVDSTPFFGLNVYASRAMSMSGEANNMKFRMGMNYEFHANNAARPGIGTAITKHIEGTGVTTIFYDAGSYKSVGSGSVQAVTVTSDGVLFGAGTNLFGGTGRWWEPSPPDDGHAYALRFYNRALAADEIAANYAIDQERFNLP